MPAVPPPIAIPFALLPHLSAADVARLRAAFAARAMVASTRRALLGDARLFVRWCAQAGHRALPAGPTTVTAFLADASTAAALRRRCAATAARWRGGTPLAATPIPAPPRH
ncbi:hypothetical protein FBZ84_1521 [Azospirillum baldaniorum]|nr:hypothetical protein FBZ84_1521 [Azospirillum baldaniorum]